MAEHRPLFRIYRGLDVTSKESLNEAEALFKGLDKPKVVIGNTRLPILGVTGLTRATSSYGASKLNSLIHPLPESAEEQVTLPVKGLYSFQGRKILPWLMVQLQDREGLIEQEVNFFRQRIDQYVKPISEMRSYAPRLALGRVAIENLTMQFVEEMEACLPESLTLQPISYPVYTPMNTSGKDETPLTPRHGYKMKRQPIPPGLLAHMRTTE